MDNLAELKKIMQDLRQSTSFTASTQSALEELGRHIIAVESWIKKNEKRSGGWITP